MFQVCGLRTFATEEDAEAREVGLQHHLLVPTGFYITMIDLTLPRTRGLY